jgi:hypothetical protein
MIDVSIALSEYLDDFTQNEVSVPFNAGFAFLLLMCLAIKMAETPMTAATAMEPPVISSTVKSFWLDGAGAGVGSGTGTALLMVRL